VEGRQPDVLDSAEAGAHVIRGSAMRSLGYFAGLALGLISVPLLTRHLGVADFGRYVIVTSLIAIVMLLADAGLTTVGVREYAVRDAEERDRLMRSLMAVRVVVAVIGAAGAVLFALIAGYDSVLVAGTALASVGLVFTIVQHTLVIPLTAELRLGIATLLDLLRQTLSVVGIVLLVAAGAGLLLFFIIPIPVGITVLLVTVLALRGHIRFAAKVERGEWRYLLTETLPAAAASTLASLFYRVAILMMSLIATAAQTGYFAASFRVVEAFVAVPFLLVGSAYPVLSRAADTDPQRLTYAFQRLFEICLILGVWIALALVAAAHPVIQVIAGRDFAPAVPVLQIQGLAITATFFVALFGGTLWTVRARGQLVIGNLVGVLSAIALTSVLVPVADAKGAAIAMVCAETLLAGWLGVALLRGHPELRPMLGVVPKVALALAAGAVFLFMPLPDVFVVALLSAAYFVVLLLFRGIPTEIWPALRRAPSR
jgi:O-antigen/teichoic acid export membrane protein